MFVEIQRSIALKKLKFGKKSGRESKKSTN